MANERSPTELLMHCLEDFGESEPLTALVIWVSEDGNLNWSSTTASLSHRIGMIELTKAYMLQKLDLTTPPRPGEKEE